MMEESALGAAMSGLAWARIERARKREAGGVVSLIAADHHDTTRCLSAMRDYFGGKGEANACTVIHNILEVG
jgi:hypothetical protein